MVKKTFENALNRLEQITAELEAGDLSLEKSLAKFSEGVELARFCSEALQEARGRVELLHSADGTLRAEPFAENSTDDEEQPI